MQLNEQQQAAAEHVDGPLLVLAGAGSGKTRVIVHKIQRLLRRGIYTPDAVFAVTFTNKAAQEMWARLRKMLPDYQLKGLSISTFHRLGFRILRSHLEAAERRPGLSLFDPGDATGAIAEIMREQGWGEASGHALRQAAESVQGRISRYKNAGRTVDAVTATADPVDAIAALCYPLYEAHLAACNAVDLDDLLLKPLVLLRDHPEIAQSWRERVGYLLVDEYQDTNQSQYELLRQLRPADVPGQARFTVVGDDDQSIYAWRGADPGNLRRLAEDYPQLEVVKLEDNYRCTPDILAAANAVIANNPHLFPKTLRTTHEDGSPVRLVRCRDGEHECDRVASEILTRHAQDDAGWGRFAVLYRSKHQARALELSFRRNEIPYALSGSQSLFDKSEIRDVLAYLRLALNGRDDAAFLRIVNTPRRQIGTRSLEALTAFAAQRRLPLLAAATEAAFTEQVPARLARDVAAFGHWLQRSATALAEDGLPALRRMLQDIDYLGWLNGQAATEDGGRSKWNAVLALLDHLERSAAKGSTLADAVTALTLREFESDEDQDANRVQLSTIHAAKGLEFTHVYVIGLEEGQLPHQNSVETAQGVEEERRLFYVAMTRAMSTLTLSYAGVRKRYGDILEQTPSRFLDELPKGALLMEGEGTVTEERQAEVVKDRLTGLKALLG